MKRYMTVAAAIGLTLASSIAIAVACAKNNKGQLRIVDEKGDTGDQGIQGEPGALGPEGDQGEPGEKGDTGDQGDQGGKS